ncbi:SDR family oxidoreductase [Brenneria salicis]|nr:SDR family oxidoreductase [Brenneria salicis]RLM32158.1 short-chain dehydrogenase [Brenneria salicis ATCC 15712 = DSM 30166]
MQLTDKIAVVTGAGSGIGRATAIRFAREGATVIVADKISDRAYQVVGEIAAAGGMARPFSLDVAQAAEVEALMAFTVATFGRIDILVNNAGYGFAATVLETSEQEWDDLMAVNVKGVFLCCKYALPCMIAQGHGAIVNTASAVSVVGIESRAAYVASKGAVAALTRALALDHTRQNIRVNCLGVGTVDSPYYQEIMAKSDDPEALMDGLRNRQLVGRLGTADEIAAAMVFLASDAASFCTGSTLFVDGGWTAR